MQRIYFTVGGRRYENVRKYTLGEASTLKRMAGMLPDEVGEAFGNGDPDALAALVFVAIRRVNPRFTEADLYALDVSDIDVIVEGEPEVEAGPPAEGDAPEGSS